MQNTIRVVHVFGGLGIGGAETMMMNLYRAIDRERVHFDFVVHTEKVGAYEEEIRSLGGTIYRCPKYTLKNHRRYVAWWRRFFAENPDIILHSHVRSSAILYLKIAKRAGIKTVIHSHSTSNGRGFSSLVKRIYQYPLRYGADYLMACSNEAGRWLYGKKALSRSNYVFCPNAIDTEKYRYSPETAERYRRELGLEGKFVVGHVGRFHEAKNHPFLLRTFALVAQKREDAMLLLVGDGALRPEIEAQVRALGLEGRVILTGNRSDVAEVMQAMDVFAFPSLWEGLPVTVVEAQASGMPCRISDRVTKDVDLTELVRRLPIDSEEAWAEAILGAEPLRRDVIAEVRKAGFDVHESAAALAEFYGLVGE